LDLRLIFAIPGDIKTRTGGYGYDRRLIAELRDMGWSVDHLAWPGSFPFPSPADERAVAASLVALPDGALVMIDGLALGAMPELAWAERDRLILVALVHHPLALESGLPAPVAESLARSERLALAAARLVITTSETTAAILAADYGIDRARIVVARPGVDLPYDHRPPQGAAAFTYLDDGLRFPRPNGERVPAKPAGEGVAPPRDCPRTIREGETAPSPSRRKAGGSLPLPKGARGFGVGARRVNAVAVGARGGKPGDIRLLAIGTITHRKGYDILVDALSRLVDLPWSCTIAGNLERAPETSAALRLQIDRAGLMTRIDLRGEVAETAALYGDADIFVLPSRYEGYGMVFAEALAHGLPVIATNAGAIPEVVPAGAGILSPVERPDLVAEALRRLIGDGDERRRMAANARGAALALPRWDETAARIASALDQLQR
jgi:glycosyltransferase involved in cell wall biosynthesis